MKESKCLSNDTQEAGAPLQVPRSIWEVLMLSCWLYHLWHIACFLFFEDCVLNQVAKPESRWQGLQYHNIIYYTSVIFLSSSTWLKPDSKFLCSHLMKSSHFWMISFLIRAHICKNKNEEWANEKLQYSKAMMVSVLK